MSWSVAAHLPSIRLFSLHMYSVYNIVANNLISWPSCMLPTRHKYPEIFMQAFKVNAFTLTLNSRTLIQYLSPHTDLTVSFYFSKVGSRKSEGPFEIWDYYQRGDYTCSNLQRPCVHSFFHNFLFCYRHVQIGVVLYKQRSGLASITPPHFSAWLTYGCSWLTTGFDESYLLPLYLKAWKWALVL